MINTETQCQHFPISISEIQTKYYSNFKFNVLFSNSPKNYWLALSIKNDRSSVHEEKRGEKNKQKKKHNFAFREIQKTLKKTLCVQLCPTQSENSFSLNSLNCFYSISRYETMGSPVQTGDKNPQAGQDSGSQHQSLSVS